MTGATIDRRQAADVLAAASAELIASWKGAADLPDSISRLATALDYYETACRDAPATEGTEGTGPIRFDLALTLVSPLARDVIGLARGIIAAAQEVTDLQRSLQRTQRSDSLRHNWHGSAKSVLGEKLSPN